MFYSLESSSGHHKMCPPRVMWLWSGCLTACSHLGPVAKCPIILWSPFAIFSANDWKSMGKSAENWQASVACQEGFFWLQGAEWTSSAGWRNGTQILKIQVHFCTPASSFPSTHRGELTSSWCICAEILFLHLAKGVPLCRWRESTILQQATLSARS